MSMRAGKQGRGWRGWPACCLVLALAAGGCFAADAALEGQDSSDKPAPQQLQLQVVHNHTRNSLEDRVALLSKALDLDTTQQSELRAVLQGQREQIKRVWSNASMPAPYRVSATRAISDRVADQIRALLNEEQLKKYNPPLQPHDASGASVEEWLNKARPASHVEPAGQAAATTTSLSQPKISRAAQ